MVRMMVAEALVTQTSCPSVGLSVRIRLLPRLLRKQKHDRIPITVGATSIILGPSLILQQGTSVRGFCAASCHLWLTRRMASGHLQHGDVHATHLATWVVLDKNLLPQRKSQNSTIYTKYRKPINMKNFHHTMHRTVVREKTNVLS